MANFQYADINSYVGVNPRPVILTDDDAVVNAIINTLLCPRRTRKFRPTYSSTISNILHRPVTNSNAIALRDLIVLELNTWVPLISLRTTDIQVVPFKSRYGYNLNISFDSIVGAGRRNTNFDLTALG
jgi:phage baseplate assembly protein W